MEMIRRHRKSSLDMSSLMDIIFILLIFVMLSMSFQKTFHSLEMDLPKSDKGTTKDNPNLRIALKENGEIFIQEKKTSWEKLEDDLQEKKSLHDMEVQLSIEKKVPYGEFVRLSAILKKLKLEKMSLVVKE